MTSRDVEAGRPVSPPPAAPDAPARPRPGPALLRHWPAGIAAFVMLALALWGLARDSAMGNDEVATRWAATLPLPQLAHLLRNVDAVHGAYYLLMHAWAVVGTSPVALRVPSVIAMTVAVALVAVTGRRLTGSGVTGVTAGLVTALTPTISYYAQTARSYALVFACVTGATLTLVYALRAEADDQPAGRRWLAYGALITVSGYLNELALLVLTAHLVTVLLARPGRPAIRRFLRSAVIGAVLVIPVVVVSSRETGAVTWIARPDAASLGLLFHDYFGAAAAVPAILIICALIALLPRLPGEPQAAPWWRAGGVSLPSVAAPLLIVPAVLLIAESLVARPFYVDRYVLYGEAGAALLAAAGAYRLGQWLTRLVTAPAGTPPVGTAPVGTAPVGTAPAGTASAGSAPTRTVPAATAPRARLLVTVPAVLLVAASLVLQLSAQRADRTPQSRQFDFGGPSRYLAAHSRPGDGILYVGAFFRKASLGYPADYTRLTDFGLAKSPAASGTFQGIDLPFAQLNPIMLRYQRIWTFGRGPLATFPPGLMRAETRELAANYTLASRVDYRGVVLTLWTRDRS